MRDLKETIGKKSKRTLKWACDGIFGVSLSSPDPRMGPTYIGRSAGMTCSGTLMLPSRTPRHKTNSATKFMVEHVCCYNKGYLVGICHNLLNNEWVEKCGEMHNPNSTNNKNKIHWVAAAAEASPTRWKVFWIRLIMGYPYMK